MSSRLLLVDLMGLFMGVLPASPGQRVTLDE